MTLINDIPEDIIHAIRIKNGLELLDKFRILFTQPSIVLNAVKGPNSKKGDKYLLYYDNDCLYFLKKKHKGFCIKLKDANIKKKNYDVY